MAVIFLLYVDSMTKIPKLLKLVRIWSVTVIVMEALLLATSPVTHLITYFDEQMVYQHGSLMPILYVLSFLSLLIANAMFIYSHRKFNFYQVLSITGFVFTIIGGVVFQVFFPAYVINNFSCSMMMFFLYSAFENPAYYSYKDTRCYNKRAFLKTIKKYYRRKKAYTVIAVKVLDYDYIRHNVGQSKVELLSGKIAERFNQTFGKSAYCIDDNCFAVLTDTGEDAANKTAHRIRKSCADPFEIALADRVIRIDVHLKLAVLPITSIDVDAAEMEEIIYSMLQASEEEHVGEKGVEELLKKLHRREKIAHIIDKTIQNDGFLVYYQPIYDVDAMRFSSSEALIRLIDDELGFISPEEFIPIAEKNGRILEIGELVFRKVCRFMKESACLKLGVHYIEINLSPVQCFHEELAETFLAIMDQYGISPLCVNLEITETAEMEHGGIRILQDNMQKMNAKGVSFSIDDFGSGFAAIDYLLRLPVSIVKIDKGILWQAMKDPNAMIVLQNTMQMLQLIGKKIVVEGVETQEMVSILRQNGCDYMQGYFYSKPLPEEEYIRFLEKK